MILQSNAVALCTPVIDVLKVYLLKYTDNFNGISIQKASPLPHLKNKINNNNKNKNKINNNNKH